MCFMLRIGDVLLLWLYVFGRYYPVPSLVFGSCLASMLVGISRTPPLFCIVDLGMLSCTLCFLMNIVSAGWLILLGIYVPWHQAGILYPLVFCKPL